MPAEQFYKTTLTNGIRILSEKVDSVHSVALGLWVLAGSNHETLETNGIAHMVEHMMFKGTRRRSAFRIANEIESLGGIINAFTSKNVTCYYLRLMSEHIGKGIDVLSDLMLNPLFKAEELQREKGVITEEIREIEDTPSDIIHDYFTQDIFPDHPLGWSVQGTVESINGLTADQLFGFVKEHYTADRILVAAAGMVEHDQLVDLVQKALGDRHGGNGEAELPQVGPVKKFQNVYPKPITQSHLVIGRRIFPQSDSRRYVLAMLNVILSGGMSSRLFHNIREKYGFVYAIYTFSDLYLTEGVFGVYAGMDPRKLDRVRELVFKELASLAEKTISKSELAKIREQFKGGMVLSLEGTQARMSRLAKMEIFEHNLMTIEQILQIVEAITVADIQDLAQYIYDRDMFVETVVQPA